MIHVVDRDGRWVLEVDPADRIIGYNGETGVTSRTILLPDTSYADWQYWVNVCNADRQVYTKPLVKEIGVGGLALRWDIDSLDSLTEGPCQISLEARQGEAIKRSGVACLTVSRSVSDEQDTSDILQLEWEAVKQYISGALSEATAAADRTEAAAAEVLDASSEMQQTYTQIKASESGRAAAETARDKAEVQRASAEAGRATAETEREQTEEERELAETNREAAETLRAGSEEERDAAEQARQSAEAEREALAESLQAYEAAILTDTASGELLELTDTAAAPLRALTVFGKTEQATTTGAQLVDFSALRNGATSVSGNGVVVTTGQDGVWSIVGTATSSGGRGVLSSGVFTLPAGTYCFRVQNTTDELTINAYVQYADTGGIIGSTTFALDAATRLYVGVNVVNGTVYNHKLRLMLNAGSTPLPWEPYTGGEPSPNPEYPQEIVSAGDSGSITVAVGTSETADNPQILTIATPNGLPGIPVASGGNYTDETGQQWVRDEIDFARGVYVQRIGAIDSYNGESVGDIYMSTTGALTTGAAVIYPLDTPAETPLSAEELAAYKALHTHYPATTIQNDSGAGMRVTYVQDSNTVIGRMQEAIAALSTPQN